jgi:hypothetical protein
MRCSGGIMKFESKGYPMMCIGTLMTLAGALLAFRVGENAVAFILFFIFVGQFLTIVSSEEMP